MFDILRSKERLGRLIARAGMTRPRLNLLVQVAQYSASEAAAMAAKQKHINGAQINPYR